MKNSKQSFSAITRLFGILLIIAILSSSKLHAQQNVYFVNYGPEAPSNSGDYYFRQFIHFKVPESYKGELFVRLYDISCGGDYDSKYGESCSEYEVILYSDFIDENEFPGGSRYADVSNKNIILSKRFSDEAECLNQWSTFACVDINKTKIKEGYMYFSLSVKAVSGNDANGFDVFLSSSNTNNIKINGSEIFCFEPTIRLQKRAERYTFRVRTEADEFSYNVRNFDFDNIDLGYSTFLRKYKIIYGSDDGKWNSAPFTLNKFEAGKDVGITIGPNYSSKIENDLVFSVQNSAGKKLPILYPPQTYFHEVFPVLNAGIVYLGDCRTAELRIDNSTDLNSSELKAHWFFEDGSEEDGLFIRKTFSSTGKFTPEVLLYNTSNEISRAVLSKFPLNINQTPVANAGENKIAALNETILFDASASKDFDGRIVAYTWDFGDGNFSTGVRTRHSYSTPGNYTVKLNVEDNFSNSPCRFDETTIQITVNNKPTAITENELTGSTDEVITFNSEKSSDTDGRITRYIWDFGLLGKKEGAVVTHIFTKPGIYKVKLTVIDNSNARNESDSKDVVVKINYPPVSIPSNNILAAINETVNFNGSKSYDKDGEIIKYEWDFGDGNIEVGTVVNHSYNKSGVYSVKLKVTDNSGTNSASSEAFLSVTVNEPPVPVAGKNIYSNSGFISFDASSSYDSDGTITKYFWDFGNGKKDEGVKVSHAYQQPGVYTVKLTVKDNTKALNNTSTTSLKVFINAKPSVSKGKNLTVAPGEIFHLSAEDSYDSDGEVVEYKWMIGNEVLSNKSTFEYKIQNPGLYQITLLIKDNFVDAAYDYSSFYITVNNSPQSFITGPKIAQVNTQIKFDASLSFDSEGDLKEYRWDFGDGTSSQEKIVNKVYDKPGNYSVKLFVRDGQNVINSISEVSHNIFINSSPIAKTNKNILTCGKYIVFDASSSADPDGDPITCYWNFFDGSAPKAGLTIKHLFEKPGVYPALLIVDDNNGLPNSRDSLLISVSVNAPPVAIIGNDSIICSGDLFILNGLLSYDPEGGTLKYEWIFDDGTTLEGATVNKVWKKSGVYQVTLKVTDNSGLPCNTSYASKIITVIESPVADAGEDVTTCINNPVYFDGGKSTDIDGIVNAYEWDFGDGETGSGVKPIHAYKNPGQYKVALIVTGNSNGKCDNKAYDELIVNVNQGPGAYFASEDSIALGSTIFLDASKSTSYEEKIISYNWDLGDGEKASGLQVNHQYKKSGNYKVTLTIKTNSQSDCNTTSYSKNIFVNNQPVAVINVVTAVGINSGFTADASKSFDADGNISKYEWNFGDGNIRYGKIVNHSYSKGGKYNIALTVTDNTNLSNNSASEEISVTVIDAPVADIQSKEKIYEGDEIEISAVMSKDFGGKDLSYSWFIDNKQIESTSEKIIYKFHFPGKYNVRVVVKDISGFEYNFSIANKFITVLPFPQIDIGGDTTICEEALLEISTSVKESFHSQASFEWYVNDELVSTAERFSYRFTVAADYKITLKIFDKIYFDGPLSTSEKKVKVNMPIEQFNIDERTEYIGFINDDIIFDAGKYLKKPNKEYSFTWDLGNRIILYGEKVSYKFTKGGIYNIILKIDDGKKTNCSVFKTQFKLILKEH
jgi:PKD repeat protein